MAFSGKQLDDAAGYVHSSGGQSNEREEDTNGGTQPDFEDEVPRADALEWKRLFVNSESEQPFRKVKMCIVQKEETLEDIAKKYDINLRELQLHNRLSDQEVSAGQILYIPK
ncbi:LysM peptidoglycan-binding domain-containing protein [Paenibacillus larvae]|uniref:LysM peptidoglycan-binding domain-containing protein n=1 Tax=Paenibacillus larvae TaxID=1464 RepID=UPI00288D4DA3|nr:LysM peptidoglycan-binding domain-containing protein [Paenibacillus larvae]MDT2193659.1 LysM peptidoglycan-binding domain-containing protein [Paenibacillus larvae]MDT2305779.1 LysM peptidoglycan-binding domain-containing protein [Paenibacillus larvae]